MKMQFFILTIPLNHYITVLEFFHWLTSRSFISAWLNSSNITLLTLPSSHFEGLIRWQCKLACKFSSWFFRVIKVGLFARYYTLSSRSSFLGMFLASRLIELLIRSVDSSYFSVIFSSRSFLYCSGSALYILLVLSAKMKTSGEVFLLQISFSICS